MTVKIEPGLGELLRYVSELVERGAEQHYQDMGLTYRARYTPVLRALEAGARTITEITARTHLTQGAISQTVSQMEADGLITRQRGADARKSEIHLAPAGQRLMPLLIGHWAVTFRAIERLEEEIGHPLRQVLQSAAQALQHQDFSQRLSAANDQPSQEYPAMHEPRSTGIRVEGGVVAFPVHFMRGGTSTGLVIDERCAPQDIALREELLRHLMGVPLHGEAPGNRQLTGLGRGPATSNKVFFVELENADGKRRLVSTLAQLAASHSAIDWSVNCGNMSSALPLWALDMGLADGASGDFEIDIRNINTGVITTGRVLRDADNALRKVAIPGVPGQFPGVDLFLHHPVGAKTGALLPTGNVLDVIGGHAVSCVDVAVPMVIIDAACFGKTAREPLAELETDSAFMQALREVWIEAGLRMGLKKRSGDLMSREDIGRSETIPKVCIIGPAAAGGTLSVRYFTPQTLHASMAVSGGCCLAAAALIPGTVAARLAAAAPQVGEQFGEYAVAMENPAGTLDATVVARDIGAGLEVRTVAYRRSAQVLQRGHVPLYNASQELTAALVALR